MSNYRISKLGDVSTDRDMFQLANRIFVEEYKTEKLSKIVSNITIFVIDDKISNFSKYAPNRERIYNRRTPKIFYKLWAVHASCVNIE